MLQLARRMGRAKPSAIMAVAEKAKALKASGRDIISFSIGVPNFLPGDHVYAAARESLSKDSGQYGSNRGADALLERPSRSTSSGVLFAASSIAEQTTGVIDVRYDKNYLGVCLSAAVAAALLFACPAAGRLRDKRQHCDCLL